MSLVPSHMGKLHLYEDWKREVMVTPPGQPELSAASRGEDGIHTQSVGLWDPWWKCLQPCIPMPSHQRPCPSSSFSYESTIAA